MRKVIVNATPLIILCHIGQLDLLKKLYAKNHHPAGGVSRSVRQA